MQTLLFDDENAIGYADKRTFDMIQHKQDHVFEQIVEQTGFYLSLLFHALLKLILKTDIVLVSVDGEVIHFDYAKFRSTVKYFWEFHVDLQQIILVF